MILDEFRCGLIEFLHYFLFVSFVNCSVEEGVHTT